MSETSEEIEVTAVLVKPTGAANRHAGPLDEDLIYDRLSAALEAYDLADEGDREDILSDLMEVVNPALEEGRRFKKVAAERRKENSTLSTALAGLRQTETEHRAEVEALREDLRQIRSLACSAAENLNDPALLKANLASIKVIAADALE